MFPQHTTSTSVAEEVLAPEKERLQEGVTRVRSSTEVCLLDSMADRLRILRFPGSEDSRTCKLEVFCRNSMD